MDRNILKFCFFYLYNKKIANQKKYFPIHYFLCYFFSSLLASPLFIEQKGIRSLIDKDARVGHKTQTENFFGYKSEYLMTSEGELITAMDVKNGANVDGQNFEELYKRTLKTGLKIDKFYGDKAYFRINIINTL